MPSESEDKFYTGFKEKEHTGNACRNQGKIPIPLPAHKNEGRISFQSETIRKFKCLERFQDKWIPVIRPETRQNKDLEPGFDSIKTG